jgi:RimJ/RimL family protein N-acetyltransferase
MITLSFFTPDDAPVLCAGDHDPEHCRWFDFPEDFTPSEEHARKVIARWAEEREAGTRFPYAVRDVTTGELLGGCELQPVADRTGVANLSYWTYPPHRGKGIATQAVALACEIAFTEMGFECVEIATDPENTASHRVAIRSGFQEIGLREGLVLHVLERPTHL